MNWILCAHKLLWPINLMLWIVREMFKNESVSKISNFKKGVWFIVKWEGQPNELDITVITLTLTWKKYFFLAFLEGGRFASEVDHCHCPSFCKVSVETNEKHRNESKNQLGLALTKNKLMAYSLKNIGHIPNQKKFQSSNKY